VRKPRFVVQTKVNDKWVTTRWTNSLDGKHLRNSFHGRVLGVLRDRAEEIAAIARDRVPDGSFRVYPMTGGKSGKAIHRGNVQRGSVA